MNVIQFIEQNLKEPPQFNARKHLKQSGFEVLYVRYSWRAYENYWIRTLDIANVEAKVKGRGRFKKLIASIQEKYPKLPIFIETVLTKRFEEGLLRMGFKRTRDLTVDFILVPKEHDKWESPTLITTSKMQSSIHSPSP